MTAQVTTAHVMTALAVAGENFAASAPSSSIAVGAVFAAGVTALVAIGLLSVALHRAGRLTPARGLLSLAVALGIAGLSVVGILQVAPSPGQADVVDGTPGAHGAPEFLETPGATVSGAGSRI